MNPSALHCRICSTPLEAGAAMGLCPQCQSKQAGEATIRVGGTAPAIQQATTHPRLHYFGDYELIEEIARGGMGVVYRARQVSLNRIVAVKMILSGQFAGEAEVKRFRVEAEAAANLQHPNIVAIHEIGEHEGRHYFSMDFIAGQNLAEYAQAHPLNPPEIARLLKLLAEAVQFAHQRGTLHRDLKPQNVLIDAQGQPHITDFGLAKQWDASKPAAMASELTEVGDVMGSPSYMAPEQAAGRTAEIGPSSDVYALGAILYELLTGQPPHRGATKHETIVQVLDAEPAAPRKLKPAIPADLEVICLKCLEKNPQQRYATSRLLAEELDRFLAGEPIQAKPAATSRKIMAWALRHPWVISGLASLVILGLGLATYGLWVKTQYLTWLAAHPGKIPVEEWWGFVEHELPFRFWVLFYVIMFATLVCFSDLNLRRSARVRVGGTRLGIYIPIALLHIVAWLYVTAKVVHICIWADAPTLVLVILMAILLPASSVGLQCIWLCLRAVHQNRSGVELPPDFLTPPLQRGLKLHGRPTIGRLWLGSLQWKPKPEQWAESRRQLRPDGLVGSLLLALALFVLASFSNPVMERPGRVIGAFINVIFIHCLAGLINPRWTATRSTLEQTSTNAARYAYVMPVVTVPGFYLLLSTVPHPPGLFESAAVGLFAGVLLVLWRYRAIVRSNGTTIPNPPV